MFRCTSLLVTVAPPSTGTQPRYGNWQHRLHSQTGGPPLFSLANTPSWYPRGRFVNLRPPGRRLRSVLDKSNAGESQNPQVDVGCYQTPHPPRPATPVWPSASGDFFSFGVDTALPIFKTALDTSSLRDHAGRLPFQAPRSGLYQGVVPRGRRSRRGSNRDPRSLPSPTSNRPPSTSDELRGGVLSDLRRQVADLQAQISTTASPSPARTSCRGRGSAPPRDRSARRGRNFFWGNAGRSRGREGSTFVLRTLSPTSTVSGEAPTLGAVGNLPDSLPNGRGLHHFRPRPRRSVGAFIGHG